MKSKRVLRFYFNAEALDRALNNLIMRYACLSAGAEGGGEYYAGKILKIIEAKDALSGFWGYLDGVIKSLPAADAGALQFYARLRTGIMGLPPGTVKCIKRALIKFLRRARFCGRFAAEEALINRFYCLL